MKVSIVEDEPKLAALLSDYLVKEGFATDIYHDGSEALEQLQQDNTDLVLLDLMLPGTDGLTICRELRKNSAVPIIMLTARVEGVKLLRKLKQCCGVWHPMIRLPGQHLQQVHSSLWTKKLQAWSSAKNAEVSQR